MTLRTRKAIGWTVLILLPTAYLIGSEIYYARSISPRGILTARDFFNRFGEPRHVHMVQRNGQSYYKFTGRSPSKFVLTTPSDPPAYVFDGPGHLVAWCRDPGDNPSYRQTWHRQSTNQVDIPAKMKGNK